MSWQAIVWLVIGLGFVVLLVLAGLQALRALRELARVKARLAGLAEQPVIAALNGARGDAQRLELSLAQATALVDRAQIALAGIRRGPVPPELLAGLAYLRTTAADLRRFRAG